MHSESLPCFSISSMLTMLTTFFYANSNDRFNEAMSIDWYTSLLLSNVRPMCGLAVFSPLPYSVRLVPALTTAHPPARHDGLFHLVISSMELEICRESKVPRCRVLYLPWIHHESGYNLLHFILLVYNINL